MRKAFSQQRRLDCRGIADVQLNLECRHESIPILKALQQYPRLYSPDARFSAHQTRETDVFFTSTEGKSGLLSGMIDARWAGQKP